MVSSAPLKIWLHAAAVVWLGTWTSPQLYNVGKAIAEVFGNKQTTSLLAWLSVICRDADFPAFFRAALFISAAALFYPFLRSLRGEWTLWKNGLQHGPNRLRQLASGFLSVALGLGLLIVLWILIESHGQKIPVGILTKISFGTVIRSLAWASLQEMFYQGLALGIFLKSMPRPKAIAFAAAFFALTHFIDPPIGMNVADPDAAGVGFELLGKIASQFADPSAWITTIIPLAGLGGILAYARCATRSLALPIGIHGGWIFADHFSTILSGRPLLHGWLALIGVIYAGQITSRIIQSPHVNTPTLTPSGA